MSRTTSPKVSNASRLLNHVLILTIPSSLSLGNSPLLHNFLAAANFKSYIRTFESKDLTKSPT